MSKEAVDHFSDEIDKLIDRYRYEYEMSYAELVGILTIKINMLCMEPIEEESADDDLVG